MAEKFLGKAFGVFHKAITLPFATFNGLQSEFNGGNFQDSFKETYRDNERELKELEEFGDKHNETVKDGAILIGTVISAVVLGKKPSK